MTLILQETIALVAQLTSKVCVFLQLYFGANDEILFRATKTLGPALEASFFGFGERCLVLT